MNILYKIYSFCIALPLFVVLTIVVALSVMIASLFGDRNVVSYYGPKWWSRITCWLFLIKVKVEGRQNIRTDQSYVFLANHQGYFDIFLVYGWLGHNFKWMMKEYLKKIPFVGYACVRSRQIYVGESRASITHAVRMAQDTLKHGMSMVIFPEGTRTYDGTMNPFKKGAFMLAGEIGLPIVPMTINGSYHIFSRTAKSVSRGTLTLKIHPSISPEKQKSMPTKRLMEQVYETINSQLTV